MSLTALESCVIRVQMANKQHVVEINHYTAQLCTWKKMKKNIAFFLPKNCARINVFCFLIDDRDDKERIEKKEGEHRICFFFKLEKKWKIVILVIK